MELDEDLAWELEWSCEACTLLNASDAMRCVACGSLRASSTSCPQVVVVVPEAKGEKRPLDESWACAACTLLNPAAATACGACRSERWVSVEKPMTAAALRAKRGKVTAAVSEEHGIWGGLGPDREFLPLPPPPEGRVTYRSATDSEVDIFADLKGEDKASEPAEKASEEVSAAAPKAEGADARPVWRSGPLFETPNNSTLHLEDAILRLASLGFEEAQCLLALEAAGGDELLARDFLLQTALAKAWIDLGPVGMLALAGGLLDVDYHAFPQAILYNIV